MQIRQVEFAFDSAKVHSDLYKEIDSPAGKSPMSIYLPKRFTEPGKPPMRIKITIEAV